MNNRIKITDFKKFQIVIFGLLWFVLLTIWDIYLFIIALMKAHHVSKSKNIAIDIT